MQPRTPAPPSKANGRDVSKRVVLLSLLCSLALILVLALLVWLFPRTTPQAGRNAPGGGKETSVAAAKDAAGGETNAAGPSGDAVRSEARSSEPDAADATVNLPSTTADQPVNPPPPIASAPVATVEPASTPTEPPATPPLFLAPVPSKGPQVLALGGLLSTGITATSAPSLPASMRSRSGAARQAAMEQNKMKPGSEDAVVKGLNWLQRNQNKDGSWGDGNRGAMTGLALLCFLGHGETTESPLYGLTVNRAVKWFIDNGTKFDGRLSMEREIGHNGVYEHAIATYALGEFYTMTKAERVLPIYKKAVGYVVAGQGPSGGWVYAYDKNAGGGDLSVSGWQIQALKAAQLTELNLPGVPHALDKAMDYLKSMKGPEGGYGYQNKAEDRYSLTGVGILCRLFWKSKPDEVSKSVNWMLAQTEKSHPVKYHSGEGNLYAWYYNTQSCLMYGGSAWTKWNGWFQDELVGAQNADGSWPPTGCTTYNITGFSNVVFRTTLAILMLEVYYRYIPTNRG